MSRYFYLLLLALAFSSCNEYQRALKSDDVKVKYDMAIKMYEKEKYSKVIRIVEPIAPAFKGKPSGEKLFYIFAQSLYKSKQYYTAGYQFETFVAAYPKSEKLEEASFMAAKSYSFLSPRYSLDQIDTYRAIDKLQAFIDTYPNSEFMPEANQVAKELREKLEKKAFEICMQYHKTADFFGDYNAAIVTFDNFLIDFPGTPYKEDALFYKFDSSYRLAVNSIFGKMEERLVSAKANYSLLMKYKSDTKYKKEADEMLAHIETELQKFSK